MTVELEAEIAARAADPEDARRIFARLGERGLDTTSLSSDGIELLTIACGSAPYLGILLGRDESRLARVAADPHLRREKPVQVMRDELAERLMGCAGDDPAELDARLRAYRADEIVRLGGREMGLGNRREVGRELAHLSDVCFDAAIDFHAAALQQRYGTPLYEDDDGVTHAATMSVIGMGKLGGEELNFCSDVDVIYIYSSDAGQAGDISLHEYFCKLCERVTASIGKVTEDEFVFRVDLRLRPEGSQGAIANSLPSAERYYETWGRAWERQAWLKARPSAGDSALGQEIMKTLRAFVYPRATSRNVVANVAELNKRIKAELVDVGLERGFDVKNGRGGIREIEFFAQAHQLIYGGHNQELRARGTLIALDQQFFAGLLTESEHRALVDAYEFLRHAEHVLQLESGRQTQRMPTDAAALDLVGRRMGRTDLETFREELSVHTSEVSRLFATLGEQDEGAPPEIAALLLGTLSKEQQQRILGEHGFADPVAAQRNLERARCKPMSPLGPTATGAGARVAPALMAELCTSPDPDQALKHVNELISRRGSWSSMWRLFDANPPLMRLIATLFGTSEYLSKSFVNHPELLDSLLQIGRAEPQLEIGLLRDALATRMVGTDDDDDGERWNRLAEFKQAQVLRIGLADVAGTLDAAAVSSELTNLADVCLQFAFELVSRRLVEQRGIARSPTGEPVTMAVMALGKMGGRELGYASDLDLVFVYGGGGESDGARPLDNVTYMSRLAQRLMGALHAMHPGGRLYEIDTRLRPSGSKGLLVSTLDQWEAYHARSARMWERQALIKLRAVAGDQGLGARVVASAERFVYGHAPGSAGRETAAEICAAIVNMRDKIERELAGAASSRDLKAGRGGIIDVEFAAQYLQLAYGHEHEVLRTRATVPALHAARDAGLGEADQLDLLIDGYRFLRTIENRMRIVHDRSVHRLPDGAALELLARRAGYRDGSALIADWDHWRGAIRGAYERLLVPPGQSSVAP